MTGIEQMLISGGDARLSIDAATGLNRFGCAPGPRSTALSFGSSTASSISSASYRRIQSEYENFRELPSCEMTLDSQMEALRDELKSLLCLSDMGTEIVFSPSGTDSTLHALALVRSLIGKIALDCILPASDETGSSVPQALSGLHFSDCTAEGVAVDQGKPIGGIGDVTLISIPRRSAVGEMRPGTCQDQEIWEAVERSVEAGHHVLLQVMDSSKLGASSPSRECQRRIQQHFPGSVHFVVDACQMRLSRTRLNDYLSAGCLVLISGSKFFTGPPFSGALLVPALLAAQLKTLPLAVFGLRDYTSRSAWPMSWLTLRASLPDRSNLGQYFRWTAAVEEMRAYFAVPQAFRCHVLHEFAEMAAALIQDYAPACFLLENENERPARDDDGSEMNTRTIFPFLVGHDGGWMSYLNTIALYKSLNQDMTALVPTALAAEICHIGQPVRIPMADGKEAGALRICADARMVSELWSVHQTNPGAFSLSQQKQEVCTILAKTALISHHL